MDYDELPTEVRADVSREAWDNVMPYVMARARKAVAAGAAPDVAMRGAFLGFKRFVTEMVHGTTDRAKAAHKIITIETYNAARSRAATQSALASLGRDLKFNPERYKESFND